VKQNFKIQDLGGLFKGTSVLADALAQDLPEDLQDNLAGCNVYMRGDWANPRRHGVADWGEEGRIWILVNGEHFWGDAIHQTSLKWLGPNDRVIYLGNWYNESVAEVAADRMSSLWVPYASLYFADRRDRTPLDLLGQRPASSSSVQQSLDAERIVAYLHHHCEDHRETAWDALNEELYSRTGHHGSALGRCNGKKHLGKQMRNLSQVDNEIDMLGNVRQISQADKTYDAVEHMYKDYLFALTMENEGNKVGYISEKIVNAYLAGTVPIYDGASQIDTVFRPESFLHVKGSMASSIDHLANLLRDSSAYERLRRPVDGVVSDKSIRDFFSWHPAVWPTHGDHLRRRILGELSKHCSEMQSQRPTEIDPTSSISHVADWLLQEVSE